MYKDSIDREAADVGMLFGDRERSGRETDDVRTLFGDRERSGRETADAETFLCGKERSGQECTADGKPDNRMEKTKKSGPSGPDCSGILVKYILVTVFCAFFGAVYEHFSFGVYSNFMIYAFAFPLLLGVLPFGLLQAGRKRAEVLEWIVSHPMMLKLWHTGAAVLTVGSLFKGILEIYGTVNALTPVYWFAGGVLLILALVIPLICRAAESIEN